MVDGTHIRALWSLPILHATAALPKRAYVLASLFLHGVKSSPVSKEFSGLAALYEHLGPHRIMDGRLDKQGRLKTPFECPLFSPCEFDGNGRELSNALRVHFGCVDIDDADAEVFQRMLEAFSSVECATYSTFSHSARGSKKIRARFMFALNRPVDAHQEYQAFIAGANELCLGLIDKETLDCTRMLFIPAAQPGLPTFRGYSPGAALDVDRVLELGKEIHARRRDAELKGINPETTATGYQLTKEDLLSVVATLRKFRTTKTKEIADSLEQLAQGKAPYANDGKKDSTLMRVAHKICEYFPYADMSSVGPLVFNSIDATNIQLANGNDAEDDTAAFIEKLERFQPDAQKDALAARNQAELSFAAYVREAWANIGISRNEPYTEDEIEGFQQQLGVDSKEMQHRWIIQRDKQYYIFFNGSYLRPVSETALVASAQRDLACARPHGVNLSSINDKGVAVYLTPQQLVTMYGTVARGANVVDLAAQSTTFNPVGQYIIEAPCPLRPITPRYHPEVHEWLVALGGSGSHQLLSWVSWVTDLDKVCALLYLGGAPGTGKSLLMRGLARLWTTQEATELERAIEKFNTAPLKCPLIKADESIPEEMMRRGTQVLREFTQSRGRAVEQKNQALGEMLGCTRLIIASNNLHMLKTSEELTKDDIEAIRTRILKIEVGPEARDVLARMRDINSLVMDDIIAEHALYLRDNRAQYGIVPVGRFLVDTTGHDMVGPLTTNSGVNSVILHWVIEYLINPLKYDQSIKDHGMIIHNGRLYVSTRAISQHWDTYTTNAPPKTMLAISRAIAGISDTRTSNINGIKGNYYPVKTELLCAWAEERGAATKEVILTSLSRDTKVAGSNRGMLKVVPALELEPKQDKV